MIVLVTGGSGSGKSEYAENLAVEYASGGEKYYIATMQVFTNDKEGMARVSRHRALRKDKGFTTIEQPVDVWKAAEKMQVICRDDRTCGFIAQNSGTDGKLKQSNGENTATIIQNKNIKKNAAILECISNLTANEMFSGNIPKSCAEVVGKVVKEVEKLAGNLEHLVIVSNNVFEDGIEYDETTMEYIRAMGEINQKLAAMADQVTEVVVGIPCRIK